MTAEQIFLLRKALKLTQARFGEHFGVGSTAVVNWESGYNSFPQNKIAILINTFGVRREWIETGEGDIFSPSAEPTPREYAKSLGCADLFADIFARYVTLDDEGKRKFNDALNFFVEFLLRDDENDADDETEESPNGTAKRKRTKKINAIQFNVNNNGEIHQTNG